MGTLSKFKKIPRLRPVNFVSVNQLLLLHRFLHPNELPQCILLVSCNTTHGHRDLSGHPASQFNLSKIYPIFIGSQLSCF